MITLATEIAKNEWPQVAATALILAFFAFVIWLVIKD